MKLLLDQNISRKLVKDLKDLFPGTNHVFALDLQEASDEEIWNYARDKGFVIVTQDSDFNERSIIYGFPPKVVWLRVGNVSTKNLKKIIRKQHKYILDFEKDNTLGCLQIF